MHTLTHVERRAGHADIMHDAAATAWFAFAFIRPIRIRFSCILIALTFYIDSIIIIIVVDINDDDEDGGCGCGCCTGLSAILLNCSIVSTVSTDNMRHKSLTSNSISMGMKKKEENESILPYYASPFTKQICECTITHTHTYTLTHTPHLAVSHTRPSHRKTTTRSKLCL